MQPRIDLHAGHLIQLTATVSGWKVQLLPLIFITALSPRLGLLRFNRYTRGYREFYNLSDFTVEIEIDPIFADRPNPVAWP